MEPGSGSGKTSGGLPTIRISFWIIVFICLCLFFAIASSHLSAMVDDAFIAFRYSKHLAEGKGLVFNENEQVEGYTSFLWVVTMSAAHKAGFDIPRSSRAISVLSAALLAVSVAVFSKSHFRDLPFPCLSYLAPALLVVNPLYLEHIGTGLESVLFALLMFLSIAAYLSHAHQARLPYLTGFLLGLGYLTRPEAIIWACSFAVLDLSWVILKKEKLNERMPEIAKYAGVFALIVVCHTVWRVSYFGDWLPNTYYAKGTVNWEWGIYYTRHFLLSAGFIPLIALIAGPFLLPKKWTLCMCVIIASTFFHNIRIGGDFIFTGRFLYPLLPLIYLITQELVRLSFIATMGSANSSPRKKMFWWVARTTMFILLLLGASRSLMFAKIGTRVSRAVTKSNMRLMDCIEENTEPTGEIAVIAAGVLPYYSERRVIDTLGLTDRHIAHYGSTDKRCTIGHQRADSNYVLDRKPEIIVILPPHPELSRISHPLNLRIAANQQMLENPRLFDLYEEIAVDCSMEPNRIYILKKQS